MSAAGGGRGGARGPDAVVIGSGPNGLACAIELARAGRRVTLYEKHARVGGGARTEALTLPGFLHDPCSAVHPLGFASPFFRSLGLEEHGLRWIHSPAELAHPLDDGRVVLLRRPVEDTAAELGRDRAAYEKLFGRLTRGFESLLPELLRPALHLPRQLLRLARFGFPALESAEVFATGRFQEPAARALFMGIAAHLNAPLTGPASSSVGLVLHLAAHVGGWPLAAGGSQAISDALASKFRSLGGRIVTETEVADLSLIPRDAQVFFDLTPRQVLAIAGPELPPGVVRAFRRYRYGPGVFKLDWALAGPIPWKNPDAALAATVHLGGTMEEIIRSEQEVAAGGHPSRPFVLLAQPSLFDPSRAPAGQHVAWAYCHVPHGSDRDLTDAIESQVERFAPGFRRLVLARSARTTLDLERYNPNLVGGDIGGGAAIGKQLFFRPRLALDPYVLDGGRRFWICSSSTPPGPGVHGMCGYHAARSALGR